MKVEESYYENVKKEKCSEKCFLRGKKCCLSKKRNKKEKG
jgi:hypothetical protein